MPGGNFDLDGVKEKLRELEEERDSPDFWDDREHVKDLMAELSRLKSLYEDWRALRREVDDIKELIDIVVDEADEHEFKEIEEQFSLLASTYKELKIKALLSEKRDYNDAFVTIHTGAGGTESCDWVQMLYRLYSRWCDKKSYTLSVLDLQESEGGIKSVSFQVRGAYAYGYLKAEIGIHRLVRISPFDSNKRRHTTFASFYASPIVEDDIDIVIRPEDIRVDTYRSTGAGGQHVNTTDSAVRITHLDTGIVVQCQNERSQMKNRQTAMKVLKSRLFAHFEEERRKEAEKYTEQKRDISWGHQIRSYVFHPYNLVKDHRTNTEMGNINAVMDGEIDVFIARYLEDRIKNV